MSDSAFTVLSHNLSWRMPNRDRAAVLARSVDADVVVWVESNEGDGRHLAHLPHVEEVVDPKRGPMGLLIASRFPVLRRETHLGAYGVPILRLLIDLPSAPFELWGVHIYPTMPYVAPHRMVASFFQRRSQLAHVRRNLGAWSKRALVAGDFNVDPRFMPDLRPFRKDCEDVLRRHGKAEPTYRFGIPLRLDHLLAKGLRSLDAETIPTPWSDHHALRARFSLEALD